MEKFSIFTCTYKTTKGQIHRLYQSLLKQTYKEWDWWILDDSPKDYKDNNFSEIKNDPRVFILKNVSHHGNIGFNKHMIAMCCDGDYLVEVDHDDELTPDCLECLYQAFQEHPDSKFVYSDCIEMVGDHMSVLYGDNFSFGQGYYKDNVEVNGWFYKVAISCPSINCKSIRGIYAAPNHVRCWERDFYHEIGGHNIELDVCDDYELCVRSFLFTKITHVNKVLYIQHEEGTQERGKDGNNTQSVRYDRIQQLNWAMYALFDKRIHERILELGFEDQIWTDEEKSDLNKDIPRTELIDLGYQTL